MAIDRREDAGEFYPGGKTISTQPVATGGDVKHSDFAGLDVKTNTLPDLRAAVKGLAARLGATVVTALAVCVAIGAEVQTAKFNELDLDADPSYVTDVNFSGVAMTGDVARVEGKVDAMTNTFLRLSGGELSGDLVVLPGVPYTVRLGKSPYTNFYGNGIWWGDEIGLADACGIVCESLLGNIHFVSQGNIISLPSSHGILALQSEIPTTMAWSAITSKPSWIGNSKPSYTASEVGAIPTTGGVFNASLHLNQKLSVGTWTSSVKPYDISDGSGIAFVFGDNVQTKQSNTMTLGVGALNTNAWSFIWNGDADRMYIPGFPAMSNPYATRHNGGFHVNPSVRSGMVNPLQNFWIGDTNLNDWISALAPTPTWDTLSGKPTTISGYGITDALKSDFTSLTNNAAFSSAVAAVSPPTDTSELEARGFVRIVADDEIYFVTITTTQTEE